MYCKSKYRFGFDFKTGNRGEIIGTGYPCLCKVLSQWSRCRHCDGFNFSSSVTILSTKSQKKVSKW